MAHDTSHNFQLTDIGVSKGYIILPAETIYHIFRYLEPRDLVRLQTVNKLFQAIINDPAIWRTQYSTTRLPLPPGPFAWQSTYFLQRALVYSARLASTWITDPLNLDSIKIFTGPRAIEPDRFRWVAGRWLLVSKGMKQIQSRDIETGSEQLLWDHGSFSGWAVTSLMTPRAHSLCVVIHLDKGRLEDPVTLLVFMVDDDTGNLSGPEVFNVPTWWLVREGFIPRLRIGKGLGPYTYISLDPTGSPKNSLVFDLRSRQFYKFPRFRTQSDLLLSYRGAWLPHLVEVYFTETYLFVLSRSYLIHDRVGDVELIQTFTFPDLDSDHNSNSTPGPTNDSAQPELRLTHEILTRQGTPRSVWLTPIRDETVDPITGTTTLRFMHTYTPFDMNADERAHLVCTDYMLPAPPTVSSVDKEEQKRMDEIVGLPYRNRNTIVRNMAPVLPITVVSHDMFSVEGQWQGNLIDASHDGFVRGVCMVTQRLGAGEVGNEGDGCRLVRGRLPQFKDVNQNFTVDARGEQCVVEVGEAYGCWGEVEASRYYEYGFDGKRGKIWHTKWDVLENNSAGEPVDRDVLAIAIDLK